VLILCLGRAHASPLSAWLRVPLSWYQSTTHALFDDETHSSIRRVYTSPQEQSAKHHFCGFCGTPLSFWTEAPATEADYISLTLGSLASADLRDLEELDILPKEAWEDAESERSAIEAVGPNVTTHAGLPWFDAMTEGSRLGKVKNSRGRGVSDDGSVQVEWEIVEWTDGGDETPIAAKRKLEDMIDSESVMEGLH
jgi:hypothetical protein